METITVLTILISWSLITFTTDYERKFEEVYSPDLITEGRSIIHSVVTLPLLIIALMFLFRYALGDVGVAIIFSLQLLVLLLYVIHFIYWQFQFRAAKAESFAQTKEYFKQFPWDELIGAYGVVSDAPEYLFDLISDDDEAREDSVNDFLFATAWHQHSTYSCTPYVVECVLHIIKSEDINDKMVGSYSLMFYLMSFIEMCIHGSKSDPKLAIAIKNEANLAEDAHGHLVYLAPSMVNLQLAQERHPDIRFHNTTETLQSRG
jgi:hypothetical protein